MALPIAVLLSGNGTTLQNLLDCIDRGELNAEIQTVISSRAGAYGLERARNAGIHAEAVVRKEFSDAEAFGAALWESVERHHVELVVLAGFMSLLPVPSAWANRIVNVHPALIPAFCGKGMYGHHVHQAVIDYGAKVTGVTVHFVDNEYDHGPIILQSPVAVHEEDTPESLAERVQAEERRVYPMAINWFAEGRLQVYDHRHVRVLPEPSA